LFTHQSPQKLKILCEHALIESAISSNRIEGKHDPWPYINYILSIFKNAYREFEDRVDQLKSPRGAKTEQVEAAVKAFSGTFTLHELERACMGVSRDMVRKVLRSLQKAGSVECLGRDPGAVWRKKG
jgi:Fic family protein